MNIQGLLTRKAEITDYLYRDRIPILCLTETHITEEIGDNEVHINNYLTVRCDSHSRHTGGVMCYVFGGLSCCADICRSFDDKMWVLGIDFESFYVLLVYRSPAAEVS